MLKFFILFFPLFNFIPKMIFTVETTLQTVPYVDLEKYMGKWYAIAQLQNRWELDCNYNTQAVYSLNKDGSIHVVNQCRKEDIRHELETSSGTMRSMDPKVNSKLKISYAPFEFLYPFFSADYWIIVLAEDYSYSVVSEPSQIYLWILSRTPTLPEDVYQKILNEITGKAPQINTDKIIKIKQDDTKQEK